MSKLKRKLLLTLLPVVILPLVALGMQSMLKLSLMASDNIENQLQVVAGNIGQQLQSELRHNAAYLELLPGSEALTTYLATRSDGVKKAYLGARVQRLFRQMMHNNPDILQLVLITPQHREELPVGKGTDPFTATTPSNQAFLNVMEQNRQPRLDRLMYSPELQQFVIKQGIRFTNTTPEIANYEADPPTYTLILTYSLQGFAEFLAHQETLYEMHLLLINHQRQILAGTPLPEWQSLSSLPQQPPARDQPLEMRQFQVSPQLDLLAIVPVSLLTRESTQLQLTTLMWLIVSMGVLVYLLHLILNRLVLRPVEQLSLLMGKVASKKLHYIPSIQAKDEVSELRNHFADMLSRLETSQRELEQSAFMDPLTGLGNRTAFLRTLQLHACSSARKRGFSITKLKLHNLGSINRTFGSRVGDMAIKHLSQLLMELLRDRSSHNPQQACLARFGADEFAFAQPLNAQRPDAVHVCQQLAVRLQRPVLLGKYQVKLHFSAGIVAKADPDRDIEELMQEASEARRQAARFPDNHWYLLDEQMAARLREDKWLESELNRAVRLGQFQLVYQPQFELPGRRIRGAEALLRWHHPEHGLVAPDRFIPLAERSGQILDIDLWVLEQACATLSRLHQQGNRHFRLAINASAAELSNPHYPSQVMRMLERHQLPASSLGIEITETALVELDEVARNMVAALKRIGVEIALDDFGTGYTSLNHLAALPLDMLKIDRCYTSQLESNPKLVDSMLQLAEAFNLQVLAEGVETQAQLDLLIHKGCHHAQGYLLSRPISEDSLAELLARQRQAEALAASPHPHADA